MIYCSMYRKLYSKKFLKINAKRFLKMWLILKFEHFSDLWSAGDET